MTKGGNWSLLGRSQQPPDGAQMARGVFVAVGSYGHRGAGHLAQPDVHAVGGAAAGIWDVSGLAESVEERDQGLAARRRRVARRRRDPREGLVTRPRLLFYCQHSVGMGHLVRSLALADALSDRFDVVLLSGGTVPPEVSVPPGLRVVPLPPLGHDDGYELVSRDPHLPLDEAKRARVRRILRGVAGRAAGGGDRRAPSVRAPQVRL